MREAIGEPREDLAGAVARRAVLHDVLEIRIPLIEHALDRALDQCAWLKLGVTMEIRGGFAGACVAAYEAGMRSGRGLCCARLPMRGRSRRELRIGCRTFFATMIRPCLPSVRLQRSQLRLKF